MSKRPLIDNILLAAQKLGQGDDKDQAMAHLMMIVYNDQHHRWGMPTRVTQAALDLADTVLYEK